EDLHGVYLVNDVFESHPRFMSKIDGYGRGYIDGYLSILPMLALSEDPATGEVSQSLSTATGPSASAETVQSVHFPTATLGRVNELALDPALPAAYYLIEGQSGIYRLDTLTGRSSKLLDRDGPKRLVVG